MSRQTVLAITCLFGLVCLAACTPTPVPASSTPEGSLPNPASVFCEEHGGRVELRTDAAGAVSGVCVFPDGSECDEWAYYRSECAPAGATPEANLPNPASVYCEEHGGRVELRTDATGAVSGVCVFPDGSECDEWAYYRGECAPAEPTSAAGETATAPPSAPTAIPTPLPIDPAGYQGWWTYTHAVYGFSIQLPPDWVVDETTTSDPLMSGHMLWLRPQQNMPGDLRLRLAFREAGDEAVLLWPTGVGEGEFIELGTLDVAGQPARRVVFVCLSGQVNSIWYHGESGANIERGGLEFGFLLTHTGEDCRSGASLEGKALHVAEMIVASLVVP